MRWMRGAGAAALAFAGTGFFFTRIAPLATGAAAKTACSAHFLSGRSLEAILAEELEPLPYVSVELSEEKRQVRSRLLGLAPATAVYREGLGCTLVHAQSPAQLRQQALFPRQFDDQAPHAFVDAYDPVLTSSLGIDRRRLESAMYFAFDEPYPEEPWRTRAVVVLYRGFLVAEGYREGFQADAPLPGEGLSFGALAVLYGYAAAGGYLPERDHAVAWPAWADDERRDLTYADLFGMADGLDFDDGDGWLADAPSMLFRREDMGRFAAQRPLQYPPHTHFAPSRGTANILSLLLRRALGDAKYHALPGRLFDALGMRSAVWELDASGTFGGTHLFASGRDWARLGQLLLQDGAWNGARLLDPEWVSWMRRPHPTSEGAFGGLLWLNRGVSDNPKARPLPSLPPDTFSLRGARGQSVTVIPSREAVVVRLGQTPGDEWPLDDFLARVLDGLPRPPAPTPPVRSAAR
ncbi:MAG: serine hydrolase [Myxococcota bacterium]